jgi:alcohol dehydrogenase
MTKIRAGGLERIGDPPPWSTSNPITVDDIDLQRPQPGEAMVRIEAAGVCRSSILRPNISNTA